MPKFYYNDAASTNKAKNLYKGVIASDTNLLQQRNPFTEAFRKGASRDQPFSWNVGKGNGPPTWWAPFGTYKKQLGTTPFTYDAARPEPREYLADVARAGHDVGYDSAIKEMKSKASQADYVAKAQARFASDPAYASKQIDKQMFGLIATAVLDVVEMAM